MKIVLVACNASYVHTNLAVRCIAHALTEHGHDAVIVERSLKDRLRDFLHALYEANGDIYGFSVYIWNRSVMLSLAADLRRLMPNARIVFGGPEISYETPEFFQHHPYVDHIIAGEGELAFPEYAAAPPPQHTILCGTPYARFPETGILYDRYPPDAHSGGIVYYESARGCPFSCSYCLSSTTVGIRAKSAEKTLEDLAEFEKVPGVQIVKFVDRTFNFDRRRADAIWRALCKPEFTKTYHFEVCADLLDEENFRTLATVPAGKIQLECGVQSTHPQTLAAIGRTADPARILAALRRIRAGGNIHLHADLIAGLPHEDIAALEKSFNDTYPCCDLLQLGFLKLLPGTPLRAECAALHYVYSPQPPYEVLQSNALSYEELYRLHRVDDVLDRFSGSGHFSNTIPFLLAREPSAFAFFSALADALDSPRSLSQRTLFSAFRRFALRRVPEANRKEAEERLLMDWYLHETAAPPDGLSLPLAEEHTAVCKAYCRRFSDTPPSQIRTVCVSFSADLLILDRHRHTWMYANSL